MSEPLVLWLPGEPERVTHQSGTRYAKGRTYKSARLRKWEKRLMDGMKPYCPERPIEGPVLLYVSFGFRARRKKDLFTWKITRPDTDNQLKTVKDVMTKMGFWHDDAQVVIELSTKAWVDDPGIVIQVEQIGPSAKEEEEE